MCVVSVLYPGKMKAPSGRVGGCDTAQHAFQFLVCSLRLAVGLWVITRIEADRGSQRQKQKACHTWEMNWGPRTEMMLAGMPCMRKSGDTMSSAVSFPEGSPGSATKWAVFENRSIMVSMVVLPLDGGRPVTKSREMLDHGRLGIGSGRSSPDRGLLDVMLRAQVAHAAAKARVSRSMVGHQNRWHRKARVRVIPG